ncbi:fungal-specific transcription factor domain-containing protein [Phaeosphaeria sp. MPI-PUGE-AT-0046c]|nr:fungal-specific transcription factor domain-containing protein [Phaeosphaeria sp. MPI-PUGE-AT-0046c]
MARGAAATSQRDDQEPPAQAVSKGSKRRCVQSACVPCRRRKSKCDGGTPLCATCTAVYKTECFYDVESENRRSKTSSASTASAGTKRDAPTATAINEDASSSASFLFNSLRTLPEDQAFDLILQIRKDPKLDIATFTETWRKNVSVPSSTPVDVNSLENDLSLLLGKPSVLQTGQSRHFGHSAGLGLVPEDENFGTGQLRTNTIHIDRKGTTWTNVTSNLTFVENLLALYFAWNHPFYVVLSRECFYKDFRAGRDKYCSSLLVNAMCAYACHLTNDPAGRTDPSNFRTAGDHFFAEARSILFEDETPSLTTVQALCIMSMREPSTGRDTSGYSYMGRCMRMCLELGLHLNNSASPVLGLTPSEIEVRKVTFWGCFIVDTVWSICTGRIAGLPRAAITLNKPILEEMSSPTETLSGSSRTQPEVVTTRMFLQEFTTLSELVNDNNYMFFAPKERLTSTRLLECYNKYQTWYRRLPTALQIENKKQPEPHTLTLHMLYHTIIVHLFRPMLKVDLVHSDVHPRDICIEAANSVSEVVRTYRQFYDFSTAHLVIPHVLLTASIVHLLYSKDNKTSYHNLIEGLQGLEDVHECHYFGARSFRILHTLSKTWNIPWPEEMLNSKLLPRNPPGGSQGPVSPLTDPLLVAPNTFATTGSHLGSNTTYSPISHAGRRESLSMFSPQVNLQLLTNAAITRPGSVPASHQQSPALNHPLTHPYNTLPYQFPQAVSSAGSNTATTVTSAPSDPTETIFWNPIPGVPGPILPRNTYQQMSPMGLETVLQHRDMGDRLGRDGFKMSEDWQASHLNGFGSGSGPNYGQQSHQPQPAGYMPRGAHSYQQQGDGMQYRGQTHGSQQGGQEDYSATWYGNQMS